MVVKHLNILGAPILQEPSQHTTSVNSQPVSAAGDVDELLSALPNQMIGAFIHAHSTGVAARTSHCEAKMPQCEQPIKGDADRCREHAVGASHERQCR